jgi:hypothetical protein
VRLGRLLRWGRVGFLRRRMPYVLEVWGQPFRTAAFYLRRPVLAWKVHRYRAAFRRAEDLLEA